MNTVLRFPFGLAKALTLSYDDGVQTDGKLIDILNRNGIKCTFNINAGLFAPENTVYPKGTAQCRLSRGEAKALYAYSGHEVASHFYTHPLPSEPLCGRGDIWYAVIPADHKPPNCT